MIRATCSYCAWFTTATPDQAGLLLRGHMSDAHKIEASPAMQQALADPLQVVAMAQQAQRRRANAAWN